MDETAARISFGISTSFLVMSPKDDTKELPQAPEPTQLPVPTQALEPTQAPEPTQLPVPTQALELKQDLPQTSQEVLPPVSSSSVDVKNAVATDSTADEVATSRKRPREESEVVVPVSEPQAKPSRHLPDEATGCLQWLRGALTPSMTNVMRTKFCDEHCIPASRMEELFAHFIACRRKLTDDATCDAAANALIDRLAEEVDEYRSYVVGHAHLRCISAAQ